MSYQNTPGGFCVPIGPSLLTLQTTNPAVLNVTMDAANEAIIMMGNVIWSDGGSHTVDTSGSSSIQWRTTAVTFANAGTTLKVGLAAPDTATGPPGRATNAADVITFDVSKSHTGGGGGVTANAWQTNAPDAGTKTIATGDLVALGIQMTARGGADSVQAAVNALNGTMQRPILTSFTGGAYAAEIAVPMAVLVASDGTIGWFFGTDIYSSISTTALNTGTSPNEIGQLYNLPFPVKIWGAYGWLQPSSNDFDIVGYSVPLSGSPVAEKTASVDGNTTAAGAGRRVEVMFASPYSLAANTDFVIAFKPTSGSSITVPTKTLDAATHRIADLFGTSGYGVSRNSGGGAFANINSSKDHIRIGLLVSAFDDGAGGGSAGVIGHPGLSGGMLS